MNEERNVFTDTELIKHAFYEKK